MREMTDIEKEEKTAEVSEEKKETGAGTEAKEDAKAAESTGSGAGAAEPEEEKLSHSEKKKVKKLEARVAELERSLAAAEDAQKAGDDRYLRMLAEYDNFRRSAAKEKDGIYADAYSDAIGALLPVLDNLDRAVGCTDAEALSGGLALTLKSFTEALAKLGVEEIKAEGETFDPNLHNAVMHVDDESAGEGQVVEVFQKGYKKGDKVIRHAVVKVAN